MHTNDTPSSAAAFRSGIRWFVMRAYKCERRAEELLSGEGGMEHFIPKRYAVRCYHGVKTRRLVPAIPGLVFVHASHGRIVEFKRRFNALQFAMWEKSTGHEYIVVPDGQMADFIRVASEHESGVTFYRPEEVDLERGTRVCIHGGKLDGVRGVFMRVKGHRNRRIVLKLDGVMAVSAEVHPDLIEVLP